MLDNQLLEQIRGYTAKMTREVFIRLGSGDHDSRADLRDMLEKVAATSEHIVVSENPLAGKGPITFSLAGGEDTDQPRILFSGIPGGHEFNSFLLALLQSGGVPLKLDEGLQKMVRRVRARLNFQTIVSLDCHNCPDVVQALNQLTLLNEGVSHEMVDGALFPELVEEKNVQGVPAVFLNGEAFSHGKLDISQIIEKILERFPPEERAGDETEVSQADLTVVGAGPAGISAAIYGARKGLNVLLVGDRAGGQVKDTMDIENMISVSKTTGPDLVHSLEQHLQDYPVTVRENVRVRSVGKAAGPDKPHVLKLNTGETVETKTLVIATGANWRELGVPGEKENIGNGVAYCPHCDGPFFKGKDVIVVGGGNSGIEAALDLSNIVRRVTVLEFMPEFKADQVLMDRVRSRDNIELLPNIATQKIVAENGSVTRLEYQNRADGSAGSIETSAVFIQIGLVPNSEFLKGVVELSPHGEVEIDPKGRTSVPGIFAAGDVTTVPYKQIVIAMGEGAKASLSAFEHIMLG